VVVRGRSKLAARTWLIERGARTEPAHDEVEGRRRKVGVVERGAGDRRVQRRPA
jgi:hypothetical protein